MLPTAARCFSITRTIGWRLRSYSLERPHARGDLGRLAIGAAGHERRDGRRVGATLVGVVGQAARHQQRAEVGVAEPQLAHLVRVLADLLGRVRRVGDEDLLRREDDVDRVLEAVDVELAVGPAGSA